MKKIGDVKQIGYDDTFDAEWREVMVDQIGYEPSNRSIKSRSSSSNVGRDISLPGGLGNSFLSVSRLLSGGFGIFMVLWLIVLLNRAYNGLGFVSFKTVLNVFTVDSSLSNNPFSSWLSSLNSSLQWFQNNISLSNIIGTVTGSPNGILATLAGIFDMLVNVPYLLSQILQALFSILSIFSNVLALVVQLVRGLGNLTSSGNLYNDSLWETRSAVWNALIS